jgi:hypothetical protein
MIYWHMYRITVTYSIHSSLNLWYRFDVGGVKSTFLRTPRPYWAVDYPGGGSFHGVIFQNEG